MGRQTRQVRKVLGNKVRVLRLQHGLSQEALGKRAALSGKFVGEVERGEKSISVDSLYRVSVALEVPLKELIDLPVQLEPALPKEPGAVLAMLSQGRTPEELRRMYEALRDFFREA
jgi:transcriptional regulator with XRE-family HTH domain